jgi:sigma-E factor negative regulatory protein RseC
VRNPVGAGVGQRVLFESRETNMLKGAFIVFVLPVAALLAGAMLGGIAGGAAGRPAVGGIAGGFLAFAAACLFVRFFDRLAGKAGGASPRIVRVIK